MAVIFSRVLMLAIVVVACGTVTGEPIKPPAVAEPCEGGACGLQSGISPYKCSDGSLAGPTGRCIRDQDGTCSWEIVACPPPDDASSGMSDASCADVDCGSRPLVPDEPCGDSGAMSGERCLPSSLGCTWVFVPCP